METGRVSSYYTRVLISRETEPEAIMRKIPIFLLALMLSVSIVPYSSFALD